MHRLIVMTKSGTPRLIALQAGRTRIGRDANNAVVLDSVKVSRSHAEIDATRGAAVLVDLGSSNGTRVNGRKVRWQALKHRDLIALGDVELRFLADGSGRTDMATLSLAVDSRTGSLERAAFARVLTPGR
ncbi:FHA domain-containing protein [Variovorax boronicumulans]|uniref:FHA domain-containing protein n=1 Tax=Variovorax boronicumulans TaxID=436515 RepID=UPI001C55F9A3